MRSRSPASDKKHSVPLSITGRRLSVLSPSMSANAGALQSPTSTPLKGFSLPVLCSKTGAVDVPVFST